MMLIGQDGHQAAPAFLYRSAQIWGWTRAFKLLMYRPTQKDKRRLTMVMGRPRAFEIDQALEQAMKVFWRLGYEGASLAELTKAMGINSPSLYAAFGSKEGLFKAVLDHYDARRKSCMAEVLSAPTARAACERLLTGLIELATDPDEPPGCLFLQGGLSCGPLTQKIPQELARRRASLEEALTERFIVAQDQGELPTSTDPAALARYLAAVCNGILIQAASGVGREELKQVANLALSAWPTRGSRRPETCAMPDPALT
jgi:AcrR family transcriptional regulator